MIIFVNENLQGITLEFIFNEEWSRLLTFSNDGITYASRDRKTGTDSVIWTKWLFGPGWFPRTILTIEELHCTIRGANIKCIAKFSIHSGQPLDYNIITVNTNCKSSDIDHDNWIFQIVKITGIRFTC